MQLVVSGNRILAHGEGFLAMGGTVINTNTGRAYQNATVVECDGCPSDIDKVGYEYHAGQFVPCAPFGVGDGNLAVVCGFDCKSIKDSGLPLRRIPYMPGILSTETKALFGKDQSAPPDDVFAFLGKFNQHWWSVLHGKVGFEYLEKRTINPESYGSVDLGFGVQYSKEISIDQSTGEVTMVNPQELSVYYDPYADTRGLQELCALAPMYLTVPNDSDTIYYVPSGATYAQRDSDATFYMSQYSSTYHPRMNIGSSCPNPVYIVTGEINTIPEGTTTYVCSSDRNAYPDSGEVDGLTYNYLGVPYDKFPAMPKIEVGSYVGTGDYGEENPNTLTFGFQPKIVFVGRGIVGTYIWGDSLGFRYEAGQSGSTSTVSTSGNTVTWYADDTNANASRQFNSEGHTYYYVALC